MYSNWKQKYVPCLALANFTCGDTSEFPDSSTNSALRDTGWIRLSLNQTALLLTNCVSDHIRAYLFAWHEHCRAESCRWILKNSAPSRATGSTGVTTAMGETSKTWLNRSLVGLKVNAVCDLRAQPLYTLGRKPSENTQKALRWIDKTPMTLSIHNDVLILKSFIGSHRRIVSTRTSNFSWVTGEKRNRRNYWPPLGAILKAHIVYFG